MPRAWAPRHTRTRRLGAWHRPRPRHPPIEIEVGDRDVRITNPDRVYFPARGETKLDLVNYYLSVGDGIVNALRERPCMMHRFPEGVAGEKVHQKRVPHGAPPWLETVRVTFPRYNRTADELCVTELAHVIWAVQMSTVEFHPWNSPARRHREARRVADRPRPDARLPLRPGAAASPTWPTRCSTSSVPSGGPRQSGGNGLHIYVRIDPAVGLQGRAAGCACLRPRGRAACARRRDDDLVAQGPRPDGSLRRLQPERPRPHDRQRLLGARQPRGHRLDPDPLGRGRRRRTARRSPSRRCPTRYAELGDLHAGIDDAVFSIDPLLEWAERDEREGAEDPGGLNDG